MTTPERRKKIDAMIKNLDDQEANREFTLKATHTDNMNDAKKVIAKSEMSTLGVGPDALHTAQKGGGKVELPVKHTDHNYPTLISELRKSYI
jgi:hypothetical protein